MRKNPARHKHHFIFTQPPLQMTCKITARMCICGKVHKFKTRHMYPSSRWVDGCAWPTSWCAAHPDKKYVSWKEYLKNIRQKRRDALDHG